MDSTGIHPRTGIRPGVPAPQQTGTKAGMCNLATQACTMPRRENATPRVSTKLYKAYGSETWVLITTSVARLKGFHLRAAYWMARKYVPQRGPQHQWVYSHLDKVLEKCGMHTIQHY